MAAKLSKEDAAMVSAIAAEDTTRSHRAIAAEVQRRLGFTISPTTAGIHRVRARQAEQREQQRQDAPTADQVEDVRTIADYQPDGRYHYDREAGIYLTFHPRFPGGVIRTTEARHREIIRRYSAMKGAADTVNQLGAWLGWARAEVLAYLHCHDMTHDRGPWTREEIAALEVDDLVAVGLELQRGIAERKLERAALEQMRQDAESFRAWRHFVLEPMLEEIRRSPLPTEPPPRAAAVRGPERSHALVLCPTDLHLGKLATPTDTRAIYDVHTASTRLLEYAGRVLDRAMVYGPPSVIYLGLGSDFLHVDGPSLATTKGTRQDVDGTSFELLRAGRDLQNALVCLVRTYAPRVHVVAMGGSNHARSLDDALLLMLGERYHNTPDVVVQCGDAHPRQYVRHGRTLLCFTHGDDCKPSALPLIMAHEQARAWGACSRRVVFSGHVHHTVEDLGGVEVYQLWSLTEPDRWHTGQGYTTANRGVAIHVLDPVEGVIGAVRAPIVD